LELLKEVFESSGSIKFNDSNNKTIS